MFPGLVEAPSLRPHPLVVNEEAKGMTMRGCSVDMHLSKLKFIYSSMLFYKQKAKY